MNVFVLELAVEHDGSRVLCVAATEDAARAAAARHFEGDRYCDRFVLGDWVNGVAHFLHKEDTEFHRAGERYDHCFDISELTVLEGASVDQEISPHQHCTAEDCPYDLSHTAAWCGYTQIRWCECVFDYPKAG